MKTNSRAVEMALEKQERRKKINRSLRLRSKKVVRDVAKLDEIMGLTTVKPEEPPTPPPKKKRRSSSTRSRAELERIHDEACDSLLNDSED